MSEQHLRPRPAPSVPGATVRRAAVLGMPVEHSLSPVLHHAAYAALGLSGWHYGRHAVDEAGLAAFVDGLGPEALEAIADMYDKAQEEGNRPLVALVLLGPRQGTLKEK